MAQILVRGLDDETVSLLKERAKRHRRSLEAEVRGILVRDARRAVDREQVIQLTRQFRDELAREGKYFTDNTAIIRELRDS